MHSRIKAATAAVGIVGAIVGFRAWRRYLVPGDVVQSPLTKVPVTDIKKSSSSEDSEQDTSLDNRHSTIRKISPLYLLIASGALSGAAAWGLLDHHPLLFGISLIAALSLSCLLVRGPSQRNSNAITVIAWVLFYFQITAVLTSLTDIFYTTNPFALLQLFVLGVCGIGLALCVAVTWAPGRPFTEPLALGVIAIVFGTLCLPALHIRLEALDFPEVTGSAVLFATGAPDERLSLDVGISHAQSLEVFTVNNSLGKDKIHWELLVTGDARLKDVNGRSARGSLPPTERFSGIVNSGSYFIFSGHFIGKFANSTSARSAVSLPSYGPGFLGGEDPKTRSTIVRDLGTRPVERLPDAFSVTVTAASALSPFESVTQS